MAPVQLGTTKDLQQWYHDERRGSATAARPHTKGEREVTNQSSFERKIGKNLRYSDFSLIFAPVKPPKTEKKHEKTFNNPYLYHGHTDGHGTGSSHYQQQCTLARFSQLRDSWACRV
jgi:hypothetical protein